MEVMTLDADVTIRGLRIQSVANKRMHWREMHRLAKTQRAEAHWAMHHAIGALPKRPMVITLTRIAPRQLDSDNAVSGLKFVRDGVADWLGIDDGSPLLDWQYRQERGEYAVRVQIARAA